MEEKIQLGEYLVGINGNIRVIPLARRNVPIAFVFPEDGVILGGGVIAVSRSSANLQLSQEFVNWLISPFAQQILMEKAFYTPTNKNVIVSDELVKLGVANQAMLKKLVSIDADAMEAQRRNWIRAVERAVAP
jgi:putative spermidine/putrescine transport system substrate-binding protein